MRQKIELYIVSLWLLFLLILVNRAQITICFTGCTFIGIEALLLANIIPAISLFFFLFGIIFYYRFKYVIGGAKRLPIQIVEIENVNYEHLTFLTTYIIPLICFDLSQIRYAIDLGILLIIIGAIYVKTNMFHANPTLALLGYQIYRADTSQKQGLIFISKEKLIKGDWVQPLSLDEKIYFVKIKTNE